MKVLVTATSLLLLITLSMGVMQPGAPLARIRAGQQADKTVADNASGIASACPKVLPDSVKIVADGHVLCAVINSIDASNAAKFVTLLERNHVRWIVMTSLGGDAGSALDMAEAIYRSGATLVVNGPCLSSCANYIFLAGREKYVIPLGVVAWHGGVPGVPADSSDPLAPLIARNNAFFAKIGVNRDLFEKYPPELLASPEFRKAVDAGRDPFWTYPKHDLEKRFFVKGIEDYWFPEYREWKKRISWASAIHLFRTDQ